MSVDKANCFQTPETRGKHIENFQLCQQMINDFSPILLKHLETLNLSAPAPFPDSLKLINHFTQLNLTVDRTLLQAANYVHNIRLNNLSKQLKTSDSEKMLNLLHEISAQRQSLSNLDSTITEFLNLTSNRKDKDMEFYLPYLAYTEKTLFERIISFLMNMTMMCTFVIKHLEESNIYSNIQIKLSSNFYDSYN